jgi:hypothetical protein
MVPDCSLSMRSTNATFGMRARARRDCDFDRRFEARAQPQHGDLACPRAGEVGRGQPASCEPERQPIAVRRRADYNETRQHSALYYQTPRI